MKSEIKNIYKFVWYAAPRFYADYPLYLFMDVCLVSLFIASYILFPAGSFFLTGVIIIASLTHAISKAKSIEWLNSIPEEIFDKYMNPVDDVKAEINNYDGSYCVNCGTSLNYLDADTNVDKNCICARCKAEEDHDYDAEPTVVFDRAGRRLEEDVIKRKLKEGKW